MSDLLSTNDATNFDIESNRGFEIGWNRVQLGLQCLIGLVVLAGVLGTFGDGWLSKEIQPFPSAPFKVTYERFWRANAPTDLIIDVTRPLEGDELKIDVGSDLLDHASIGSTQPRATSVDATSAGVTYTFRLGPDRKGSVTFKLAPRHVGRVEASLAAQGERLALPIFIYP